jgi:hypothetical protein
MFNRLPSEFWRKEARVFVFFLLVLFAVSYLPDKFSLSGKSPFYEKYYVQTVPFSTWQLLTGLYLVRLVILMAIESTKKRFRKNETIRRVNQL